MARITDLRAALRAAVEPLLADGDRVDVAAGESEYEQGLAALRFDVVVTCEAGDEQALEHLDELLDPEAGVRMALLACDPPAVLRRTSGHRQLSNGAVCAIWTVEIPS